MENQEIIVNPTEEQLRSLKGIVYYIKNKVTNQYYIGQTIKSFNRRYRGGWHKSTKNPYLKNSLNKYGVESFEIAIIKHSIKSLDELNSLESEYSFKYNSYIHDGFNISPCGWNHVRTDEYRLKRSNANAKNFEIKNYLTGEVIRGFNFKKFCKDNNIDPSCKIFKDVGFTAGPYTNIKTETYDINNRRFYKIYNARPPYKLYDKFEKEHIFYDIKEFCENNKILPARLMDMITGKIPYTCGFYTQKDGFENLVKSRSGHDHNKESIDLIRNSPKKYLGVSPVICLKTGIYGYNVRVKYNNKIYTKRFSNLNDALLYRDKITYTIHRDATLLNNPLITKDFNYEEAQILLDNISVKRPKKIMSTIRRESGKNKWSFAYPFEGSVKRKDFDNEIDAKIFSDRFLLFIKDKARPIFYENKKEEYSKMPNDDILEFLYKRKMQSILIKLNVLGF